MKLLVKVMVQLEDSAFESGTERLWIYYKVSVDSTYWFNSEHSIPCLSSAMGQSPMSGTSFLFSVN